jgi:hypothetical protein
MLAIGAQTTTEQHQKKEIAKLQEKVCVATFNGVMITGLASCTASCFVDNTAQSQALRTFGLASVAVGLLTSIGIQWFRRDSKQQKD